MSFFKDFKEDLSAAVNEMLPGEEEQEIKEAVAEEEADPVEEKMDELNELLKEATASAIKKETTPVQPAPAPAAAPA